MDAEALPTKMPEAFKGFLSPYPRRAMTEDETKLFMSLLMLEQTPTNLPKIHDDLMKKSQGYAILYKRVKFYNVPTTPTLVAWTASLCDNPGHCVVMAWTIASVYAEMRKPLVITDLGMGIFAEGVPDIENNDAWEACWTAQKANGVNLIDCVPWPHQPQG